MFEYFTAAGTAVADGVFIPIADFANGGLLPGELAAATNNFEKEGKVVYAILEIFAKNTTFNDPTTPNKLTNKLGVAITKSAPTVSGNLNTFLETYTMSWQAVGDPKNNTYNVLPLPLTGTYATSSKISIPDVFPSASKIPAAGSVPGEGVLIPSSLLVDYLGPDYVDLDLTEDNRQWIAGLFWFMILNINERDAVDATAVIPGALPDTVTFILPDAAFTATNPTTGLDGTLQNTYLTVTYTGSITFERGSNADMTKVDVVLRTL